MIDLLNGMRVMEPEDYPEYNSSWEYKGFKIDLYPQYGSQVLNGIKCCDLHLAITSPTGESWWETSLLAGDPAEVKAQALRHAKSVIANWEKALEEFYANC